jgi:hypothetical protein
LRSFSLVDSAGFEVPTCFMDYATAARIGDTLSTGDGYFFPRQPLEQGMTYTAAVGYEPISAGGFGADETLPLEQVEWSFTALEYRAPTNLGVSVVQDTVELTWQSPAEPPQDYYVETSIDGGATWLSDVIDGSRTSVTVSLRLGEPTLLRIRADNDFRGSYALESDELIAEITLDENARAYDRARRCHGFWC